MLPSDFAAGRPRLFDLPSEWGKIERRYRSLGDSATLKWVYAHVRDLGATDAMLEHEYIDGDYRDEYANFYIQVFNNFPDRCERLHFWARERYLGYCSIRPIPGHPVCRTMLTPGSRIGRAVSCTVRAKSHPYGRDLEVEAFPFISQDGRYGRCAHAVLWMIAHYHHMVNGTPACMMSDIVKAAAEHETERTVPSRGLTDEQIGYALRRIGLSAVTYRVRAREAGERRPSEEGQEADGVGTGEYQSHEDSREREAEGPSESGAFEESHDEHAEHPGEWLLEASEVRALVCRYLNSRIPLVLATPEHLTAIIGARRGKQSLEVVRCDDEQGVYCPEPIDLDADSEDLWLQLFVPLPGRIYLLGEEVIAPARDRLADLALISGDDLLWERTLRYREYVVDSRAYKTSLASRGMPESAVSAHLQVSCPRWLWVVEAQDDELARAKESCTLAEVAIDATSAKDDMRFLFANVPGLRAVWRPEHAEPEAFFDKEPFRPYQSGTALNL